ncbi:MAG: hypothetical protein CR988_02820 [Treponema sp.]|nr:MAG: hypothetical protein CR988_02820 [Treponema sp.]
MKRLFCFICLFGLLIFGCKKQEVLANLQLPPDSPMTDANRYAVIIETYISLKDKPGQDGITLAHARCKDIFSVIGIDIIQIDDEQELWVHLDGGWIPRDSVQLYSSEEKAKTAADNLNK